MRRLTAAAALVLALAGSAAADPLDEALRLVLEHHPEMQAREAEFRELRSASRWSADLELSLTEGRTEYGTQGGHRAGVTVSIPLAGSDHDAKRARARREWETAQDAMRTAFLAEVTELRMAKEQVEAARERRDYWRDRLEYQQESVEAGVREPDELWTQADRLQQAEHELRRALAAWEAALEEVARGYGGQEWQQLRTLLAEIAS